jgi:hypothetical protein
MAHSAAQTVTEYLGELPPDRRDAISAVRKVILSNLPKGYEEGMQYGMIGYFIPLSTYPETYNGQALGIAALVSQKNYMSLYLMAVYGNPAIEEWFTRRFKESGKKLDMGKSCVRFKKLDDLPLDLIGETIAKVPVDEYIRYYEASRAQTKSRR